MASQLSIDNARKLRPNCPFHLPPPAQPINAVVVLSLENAGDEPRIVLKDTRRDYTWHIVMMQDSQQPDLWHAEIRLPVEVTIVEYYFLVGEEKVLEKRQVENTNHLVHDWHELPFKIAVYDPDQMPAPWTQGMVVYQIFPDRFAKSQSDDEVKARLRGVYGFEPKFMQWGELPENPPLGRDFFGGDLRGVIDKLDYLHDLGVECIYFNPIFEAASNHRYEAIDFSKIDPILGTEVDFDELIEEAHKRGIKIVLDAVFNHCSSDSIYFDITGQYGNGAYHSKHSPYYRWFKFTNFPQVYDGWMGFGFMPEFVECPEMEAYFVGTDGITQYWLKKGIDGWRADVAFDNTDEFWRRFRKAVDAVNPDAWTIAEEWRDATHYMLGDTFNATMNYRFLWAVRGCFALGELLPSELDDRLQTWMRDTPPPALNSQMNLLDSHDTNRVLTACNGNQQVFRQIVAFQLAFPGSPTIYYGNETGLEGTTAEDGRRCMPWDNLDEDMVAYFKRLMNFRKKSSALRLGETETVLIDDAKCAYGFVRYTDNDVVYAVFNGSDNPANLEVRLRDGTPSGTWRDVLETHPDVEAPNDVLRITLQARGAAWYVPG